MSTSYCFYYFIAAEGICLFFLSGRCLKGEDCPLKHLKEDEVDEYLDEVDKKKEAKEKEGGEEAREGSPEGKDDVPQKDAKICFFHLQGKCRYGNNCKNKHIEENKLNRIWGIDNPSKNEAEGRGRRNAQQFNPAKKQKEMKEREEAKRKHDEEDYYEHEYEDDDKKWQKEEEDGEWCEDCPWYESEDDEANNQRRNVCMLDIQGRCKKGEGCEFKHLNDAEKSEVFEGVANDIFKMSREKAEKEAADKKAKETNAAYEEWGDDEWKEWKNPIQKGGGKRNSRIEGEWQEKEVTWPRKGWGSEQAKYKGAQKGKGKGKGGKGKGKSSKHKAYGEWSYSPFNTFQGQAPWKKR